MSDVDRWLAGLGLERYGPAFNEAEIEFSDLGQLSADDLKELGLPLGPRRRIQEAIKQFDGRLIGQRHNKTATAGRAKRTHHAPRDARPSRGA